MPVYLDLPHPVISEKLALVAGWVAGYEDRSAIQLSVNGKALPFTPYDRQDVVEAFPDFPIVLGVIASINLLALPAAETIEIILQYGNEKHVTKSDLAETLRNSLNLESKLAGASRRFCEVHLRCPACGAERKSLAFDGRLVTCRNCRETYSQKSRALNMISGELELEANIAYSPNVSSNPYPPNCIALIERTVAAGGWVLDCGAGSRDHRRPHVINLEIVDYPSTDILAIGESLPFADNSFDAVLSLAVLEHIRDPFRCAEEMARVLKPGGTLIADVPFLQPQHGYPHHYYNMTEQGLRNLFVNFLEIESCTTPPHGHPMFGIAWTLSQYRLGLSEHLRERFDRMTVAEITNLNIPDFLGTDLASLSDEARQIVSCLNSLEARKC